ncbi:MAG TPA: helix-turn-helix domain-containing protein [Iamia sp.]|nr:helix-turn-helix domain-containing protein [Iamia sp.]
MARRADEPSGLRAAHVADTRRRIVDAVNGLLAEEHPANLSVPAVARRAGTSTATIYRHFASKEALLDASASSVDRQTRSWLGDEAIVPGRNLGDFMRRMWAELAENLPALRSAQLSTGGRDLRLRRSDRRRQDAARGLTEAGVDIESEEGQRLLRVALVLTSSATLLEQVDRLGLGPEDAADDVTWAIETLTRATAAPERP